MADLLFDALIDEVSRGCQQVLAWVDENPDDGDLGQVYGAGCAGRHEEAHEWVLEFIKEGIPRDPTMRRHAVDDPEQFVADWRVNVRHYLKRFYTTGEVPDVG